MANAFAAVRTVRRASRRVGGIDRGDHVQPAGRRHAAGQHRGQRGLVELQQHRRAGHSLPDLGNVRRHALGQRLRPGRPRRPGRPAPGSGCGTARSWRPASTARTPESSARCRSHWRPAPARPGRAAAARWRAASRVLAGPAKRQPRVVVSTARPVSSAAVRPVRSAPGPRPGSSGRCGKPGSSPSTTATASAGSVPGIEPTPVALPGGQGKGGISWLTQPSLATAPPGGPDQALDPAGRSAGAVRLTPVRPAPP